MCINSQQHVIYNKKISHSFQRESPPACFWGIRKIAQSVPQPANHWQEIHSKRQECIQSASLNLGPEGPWRYRYRASICNARAETGSIQKGRAINDIHWSRVSWSWTCGDVATGGAVVTPNSCGCKANKLLVLNLCFYVLCKNASSY